MRKLLLSLGLLLVTFVSVKAQLSFESTTDYGKIWDIKYDQHTPNRLYAISLVNHVMQSDDNGATWKILYSFPDDKTRLTTLRIAPGGHALTFTAVGNANAKENGVYVFSLLTNNIANHYVCPNWTDNPTVVSYSLYNESASTILLHTSYPVGFGVATKVYYSKDSGNNWRLIYFSDNWDRVQINNVAISPADSAKIFLARSLGSEGINGGLFVSEDAGINYNELLEGVPVDPITFDPTNPNNILIGSAISFGAATEALYKSTDGGNTVNQVTSISFNDQTLNNITHIEFDPTTSNTIWVLDENEIIKSTDGGATWNNSVYTPDNVTYTYGTSISFDPLNGEHLFIVSDGYPQYSADGGATLTQVKNPFLDATTKVSFGNYATDKHLYYSTLGGYLDKNLTTNNTLAYTINTPFIINARIKVTIADSTIPGRVFIYTPGDGFFNTATLQYSDDFGVTLNSLPSDDFSNKLDCLTKDPNNANVYYVSYSSFGNANLFRLDFSDVNNIHADNITAPFAGVITGITLLKNNAGIIYLAQDHKVYKSIDGGTTWTEKITGLDLIEGVDFITDMHNNPLNTAQFIVASNKGLYISNDSTEHWTMSLADFPGSKVNFSPVTNGHIVAGSLTSNTVTTGLAYTVDGGANWTSVESNQLNYLQAGTLDFHFMPTAIDVYFGSSDLGVVKYSITGLANPLPVRLISFSGSKQNGIAKLLWKATGEQNLRQYELERSVDGRNFTNINTAAAFNTPGDHVYNYDDLAFKTISGIAYYRLKIVDIDGRSTYSAIVSLRNDDKKGSSISVYPNPVVNQLSLHVETGIAGNYAIRITDAAGKTYIQKAYSIPTGNTIINLPVERFAKGVYVVSVQNADGSITHTKFIKQ